MPNRLAARPSTRPSTEAGACRPLPNLGRPPPSLLSTSMPNHILTTACTYIGVSADISIVVCNHANT
eukprot:1614990-Pyramimonas_sp.AAC.1